MSEMRKVEGKCGKDRFNAEKVFSVAEGICKGHNDCYNGFYS